MLVDDDSGYAEMHDRPLGVVGAISTWNWPMMISIWQIVPALRMGNTVVMKPAETTTLSVVVLNAVINQALPEGLLNVVAGPVSAVGDSLTRSPKPEARSPKPEDPQNHVHGIDTGGQAHHRSVGEQGDAAHA